MYNRFSGFAQGWLKEGTVRRIEWRPHCGKIISSVCVQLSPWV